MTSSLIIDLFLTLNFVKTKTFDLNKGLEKKDLFSQFICYGFNGSLIYSLTLLTGPNFPKSSLLVMDVTLYKRCGQE